MTLLHADATFAVGDRRLQVALEVSRGEVLALVGANGAGKSSIVEALAGLGSHVDGTVERDQAAGLGWAPQSAGLLPRRKVRQQVEVFARPDRSPLLASGVTIDHLLTALGIAHLADRRPDGLSGGEAQRVAVARALAAGALALLDEPTSAQDPDGARAVRRAIEAHRAVGGGAVVVTHQLDDAWLVAGRACLVEDLATTRAGPPSSFGTTVLRGQVGTDHLLRGEDGDLVVPDDVAPGAAVAIVRAEAVTLHRTVPAGSSARNVVRALVERIEEVDGRLHVFLDATPGLVAALTRTAVDELELTAGATVWATCKASDVHVHRT